MRQFGLRDDQWQRIKDLLPGARRLGRDDGGGQLVIPRSGALSLFYRDAVASRRREHHDRKRERQKTWGTLNWLAVSLAT
jgi:hypothetical protein